MIGNKVMSILSTCAAGVTLWNKGLKRILTTKLVVNTPLVSGTNQGCKLFAY